MAEPVTQNYLIKKVTRIAAVVVLLSGCANQPQNVDETYDPLEGLNRTVYGFNELIDTWFLRPAATLYRGVLPPPVQEGIHNMLANLSAPVIFVNDLLQGEPDRAGTTLTRFALNSTVGVLGFSDPAAEMGYKKHSEDFGQTLATWGVSGGPYIVLPVFGPSNPRDVVGRVVDYYTDPLNNWASNTESEAFPIARSVVTAVDTRAYYYDAIEDINKNSLDPYVAMRSYYLQRRAAEIRNDDQPKAKAAPDLSFDFDAPSPGNEEITEAR